MGDVLSFLLCSFSVTLIKKGSSHVPFLHLVGYVCLLEQWIQAGRYLPLQHPIFILHLAHLLRNLEVEKSHIIKQSNQYSHRKLWVQSKNLQLVFSQIKALLIRRVQIRVSFREICKLDGIWFHLKIMLLQTIIGGPLRESEENFVMRRHVWLIVRLINSWWGIMRSQKHP